jgi:hypothetical protein
MIKMAEIKNDYRNMLPQIDEKEVRILWHCAYYDGPRDGVMLYQEKPHWFQIEDADADFRVRVDSTGQKWKDWYARFLVIALTDDQFQEEVYWHNLFRQKVGTYWDYDEQGRRVQEPAKPLVTSVEYYEAAKHRTPRNLASNVVVGWFESLWASVEDDSLQVKAARPDVLPRQDLGGFAQRPITKRSEY